MGSLGGAGAAGLSDQVDIAFATTSDGSIPQQADNDRPTVETLLKQRMKTSQGWGAAHLAGFGGLPEGMPLVIGIIAKIAEQITGLPVTSWITMWTENPIIETLQNIAQDALASIFTVNVNLQSIWEGLDFNSLSFNPEDAWNFISSLVPDWLEELIFGVPNSEFPMTFPHGFAPEPNIASRFFYLLRQFTGIDSFEDLFTTNPLELIFHFIEFIVKPQGLLAWLIDGILPDDQAPNIVWEIMDAIVKGFSGIPIVGPLVQGVWGAINGLFGIGTEAQSTATANSVQIADIKTQLTVSDVPGGVKVFDEFDRSTASVTNLGADYTQVYAGAGAGTEGTLNGFAHWFPTGGAVRQVVNRVNTPLTTLTQYAAFILKTKVTAASHSNPSRSLFLRAKADLSDMVRVDIHPTSASLVLVSGGVVVQQETATGLVFASGDSWEVFAGDDADDYHYVVKRNGLTVIDYVDSAHELALDVDDHVYTGFGGVAGVQFALLFVQAVPPDVAAFTATDRAA